MVVVMMLETGGRVHGVILPRDPARVKFLAKKKVQPGSFPRLTRREIPERLHSSRGESTRPAGRTAPDATIASSP